MNNGRIVYVDRLKGIAILLVVMGHLLLVSFDNANGNPLFTVCETTEMMLFSFLSGFVTKGMTFRKLFYKIPGLLLPMLTIGIVYTYYSGRNWEDFLYSPFKCGYWYFVFMVYSYLCSCVINRLGVVFNAHYLRIIQDVFWGLSFFLLFKILRSLIGVTWNYDFCSITVFTCYWPYFLLGMITRKYHLDDYLTQTNILFSLALLSYVPFTYLYLKHGFLFMHFAAISAIVVLLYLFSGRENETSRVETALSYIGKSSIDVYLFHFFFLNAINLHDLGTWVDDSKNYFLQSVLILGIALLISCLCILLAKIIRKSHLLLFIIYGKTGPS